MGQTISGSVVVDQAGLATAANDLSRSATTIRNYIGNVTDNMFGTGRNGAESEAGRKYVEQGKRVHEAMERVSNWLAIWTTATEDTASAIGKVSIELANVDENNARKTNKAADDPSLNK
ncbi:hypothetical protein SAMN04244553_4968 [Nocardia amikacinitolerans]|uniref:Excreted virulence factor EspC, type VII ESX diderm n=1 Tax=Nocardia amikacinitolerans TaxID=756689 RepID=A0A285LSY4_9NOCA|nr:hypothetical protein [Nocardia amikacinitolerans]MCP2277106.1 hypothetical protein [Nocardia amikacinitolerans]MCP2295554.1 hypothetical protein [Nocardia amikacinitolerans]MCP2317632.1 hypothetical protein [Nocardia amikacinitolerans]SNY88008.1 hypothetical protein SAMN04244553_4968 [Nocardia amikacinitolerans]